MCRKICGQSVQQHGSENWSAPVVEVKWTWTRRRKCVESTRSKDDGRSAICPGIETRRLGRQPSRHALQDVPTSPKVILGQNEKSSFTLCPVVWECFHTTYKHKKHTCI